MALKPLIYEQCGRCGKTNAVVRGETVHVGHVCDQPVPGPPNPPRTYALKDVVFIPLPDNLTR